MFDSFDSLTIAGDDADIFLRRAGQGPALLLLHGYPQSHLMWHLVAPALARDFTVICPDLRGYGRSSRPEPDAEHRAYAKRTMARDLALVMDRLGHRRFMVAGHDRGGRVAHRLALDQPERVSALAVLDIVPTLTTFDHTDMALAMGYYHWFFLAQPAPLPERMIGADPQFWITSKLARWSGSGLAAFDPAMVDAYVDAFRDPAVVQASCEDYRAAATVDLEDDRADQDRRIACPLLALWGQKGLMHRLFDVAATWQAKASGPVEGQVLPCGHFLPEEASIETEGALRTFFERFT